ncbi:trimeric intracellular cation channel family protein [Insolitispirillum peregrinum]|uniref:Uncharacterized membrane protein YeiH n=1 Tax=Insolitispirillum peregrinum TaxID=80876 RepID=A0A1N7PK62_9PROT|nr:trimeric intracellular cation channel family protein [Insolitispirillum peregrinum]SIT11015.1 Uncharacterized membrane protein YeiH [Insolitispirillum peregrinum]
MIPVSLATASEAVAAVEQALLVVDLVAVAVFAISGALVAARKEMDPVGFIFLGTATGIGGGTFRDLVLGVPLLWVQQPVYLWVCIIASLATFWGARLLGSRYRALLWMDAVGMAMFAVAGTQKATSLGHGPLVATLMGVFTAALGGLVRDMMAGEEPLLFHREIYATAAVVAGLGYLGLLALGIPGELAGMGGFVAGFITRAAAIRYGLSLPSYRRPDRPLDGPSGR